MIFIIYNNMKKFITFLKLILMHFHILLKEGEAVDVRKYMFVAIIQLYIYTFHTNLLNIFEYN